MISMKYYSGRELLICIILLGVVKITEKQVFPEIKRYQVYF